MNYETHSKDISGLRARLQSASSRLRRKAVSFENPARIDLMYDSSDWVEFKGAEPMQIRTLQKNGEQVAVVEIYWPRTAYFPPHFHPDTVEEFKILSGTLTFFLEENADPIDVHTGEEFVIEAGQPHAGIGHAGTRARVTLHPPMDAIAA